MEAKTRHQVFTIVAHLDDFELNWFRQILYRTRDNCNVLQVKLLNIIAQTPRLTIPQLRSKLGVEIKGASLFVILTQLEATIVANMPSIEQGKLSKSTIHTLKDAAQRCEEVCNWSNRFVPEVSRCFSSLTFVPESSANDKHRNNLFWN